MKTKRITHQLITSVVKAIESGLTNKESCAINDISETTFYRWLNDADTARSTDADALTDYQKLCVKFCESLKKAKIRRQQKRIEALEGMPNPTGIIFLMRNEDPARWNRQPHLIPNFEKLFHYMQNEYTQAEFEAVQDAIFAAEQRRQSEVEFDEDDLFKEKLKSDIPTLE